MISSLLASLLLITWTAMLAPQTQSSPTAGAQPPRSWVDPDTGHRIVRLTSEPSSASL
ncbi:MAG: oligogalacturonate lyase, partial [Acidobacteria bacterium]